MVGMSLSLNKLQHQGLAACGGGDEYMFSFLFANQFQ